MATASLESVKFTALSGSAWMVQGIELTSPHTRNGETHGTPYDPRLGALENGVKCHTCGGDNTCCPGHFGWTRLVAPMFNPVYIDIVHTILRCICAFCSNPLIPREKAEVLGLMSLKADARLSAYKKHCENINVCSPCKGKKQLKFFFESHTIYMHIGDRKKAQPITADNVYTIFRKITDENFELLGFNNYEDESPLDRFLPSSKLPSPPVLLEKFRAEQGVVKVKNGKKGALVVKVPEKEISRSLEKVSLFKTRPENFIFTILPILPPHARPWVFKGNEKKDDDLTTLYNTIIKLNNKLRADQTGRGDLIMTKGKRKVNTKLKDTARVKALADLQNHITQLIDSSKGNTTQNVRPTKGIRNRIGGKGGHGQLNVVGKRVDFSARTVIVSGGSSIKVGEVGVPRYMAQILTVPEIVTAWNIDYYTHLLRERKINNVIRGGHIINVARVTLRHSRPFAWMGVEGLMVYDTVERQIMDGDWGVLNRQPTLRIESMQGVRIKIISENVFRVPPINASPYNADRP